MTFIEPDSPGGQPEITPPDTPGPDIDPGDTPAEVPPSQPEQDDNDSRPYGAR